jgi:hypothetical protein
MAPSSRTQRARAAIGVVVATTAVLGSIIASTPSCGGPPSKTCNATEGLPSFVTSTYPGPDTCAVCLQAKNAPKSCCDAVGACAEDQEGCGQPFLEAHTCVTRAPSEEGRCKGLLTTDKSKALYGCMRSNCGPECGVPSCDLDPAFVLFSNPTCDRCVGSSCCEKINACYKNRECVLVLKCIVERCPKSLAPSLTALGDATEEQRTAATNAVCAGQALPPDNEPLGCVQRCIEDFAPGGERGTTNDTEARCLAFGVFTCGAAAKCGPVCADAGASGAYVEDELHDASADGAKAP